MGVVYDDIAENESSGKFGALLFGGAQSESGWVANWYMPSRTSGAAGHVGHT